MLTRECHIIDVIDMLHQLCGMLQGEKARKSRTILQIEKRYRKTCKMQNCGSNSNNHWSLRYN